MSDDGVREHRGVMGIRQINGQGTLRAWETETEIIVRAWNAANGVEVPVNTASARRFADQLYDLARRIEERRQRVAPIIPKPAIEAMHREGEARRLAHERAVARGKAQWEGLTPEQRRERAARIRAGQPADSNREAAT